MDGSADAHIGSTSTDIACHGTVNIGIAGFLVGFQQCRSTHDLPALTVTALGNVMLDPGRLHSFADLVLAHGFDSGDFLPRDRRDGRDARAYRLAIQVHGAGTAQCCTAAKLGASQAQRIAQRPEYGRGRIGIYLVFFAIDIQCSHGTNLHLVRWLQGRTGKNEENRVGKSGWQVYPYLVYLTTIE
jgi:hypothetical protein